MMHGREKSGPAMSHREADERSRATGRGAGGAKGGGRGECEPAKRVPDTAPGRRVTSAGAHTASRAASPSHPRWEPDALIGPVRFCAGGRPVMGVPTAILHFFWRVTSNAWNTAPGGTPLK